MSPLIPAIVSLAAVLVVGNFLIVAHELGHYATARLLDLNAERFTIGIGPTLFSRKDKRGTEWKLALLPAGGFVSFPGERDRNSRGSYAARTPLTRMAIIAAGPAVNLFLAVVVFAGLLVIQGKPELLPGVSHVVPHSPAEDAGFRIGDRISLVESTPIEFFDQLRPVLQASAGKILAFTIIRDGSTIDVSASLSSRSVESRQVGFLGIQSVKRTYARISVIEATAAAVGKTWQAITDTIGGIVGAVTTGKGTQNFAGVLGITQLAGQAAVSGDTSIFTLIAILSANLALMNLMPIPVLDGGALAFCAAEWMRGRPASL